MPKRSKGSNINVAGEAADFFKDIGKAMLRGFGTILGIGVAAALFGGAGGGIAAAIYGWPIIGFAIGGAVLAVVAVFALWLIVMADY